MGTTSTATKAERNGQPTPALRVTPTARGRWQARAPWLVLAVLLVAAGMLAAVLVLSQVNRRSPAVALTTAVERGAQLARQDLRVVQVAADSPLPTLDPGEVNAVVGRTVTAALPAGTLLSQEMLSRSDLVPDGADVVGMALDPGSYPVADLQPGDTVGVLRVASDGSRDAQSLTDAEVHAVTEVGETVPGQFVSLVVPDAAVEAVTTAAARGEARLVLRGSGQ